MWPEAQSGARLLMLATLHGWGPTSGQPTWLMIGAEEGAQIRAGRGLLCVDVSRLSCSWPTFLVGGLSGP